jgi:hypothetical protein
VAKNIFTIATKKRESHDKKKAVMDLLQEVERGNSLSEPLSKAWICKHAGVSKAFLYSYPDLLRATEAVIYKKSSSPVPARNKLTASDASKDKLIESLKRTVQTLREENQMLNRIL